MSGITLTEDEADALRDLFAALAVIESNGLRHDRVIEISQHVWRDLVTRPAERLRRVSSRRRLRESQP